MSYTDFCNQYRDLLKKINTKSKVKYDLVLSNEKYFIYTYNNEFGKTELVTNGLDKDELISHLEDLSKIA